MPASQFSRFPGCWPTDIPDMSWLQTQGPVMHQHTLPPQAIAMPPPSHNMGFQSAPGLPQQGAGCAGLESLRLEELAAMSGLLAAGVPAAKGMWASDWNTMQALTPLVPHPAPPAVAVPPVAPLHSVAVQQQLEAAAAAAQLKQAIVQQQQTQRLALELAALLPGLGLDTSSLEALTSYLALASTPAAAAAALALAQAPQGEAGTVRTASRRTLKRREQARRCRERLLQQGYVRVQGRWYHPGQDRWYQPAAEESAMLNEQ